MVGILQSVGRARCGARWGLLLAALLGLGPTGHAANPLADLQFDVFLGHDGIVREASWFPVVCELKNDGPSFNGVIEITGSGFNQGQPRRTVVELPTGTLKRIVIPVFCPSRNLSSWDARLRDDRGKLRGEQPGLRPRRQLGWETPLIAALPRTAGGLPVLRQPLVQQQDAQPAVARWQPAIFPDNPIVLEGLDALYLSSEKASELSVGQARAILAWLHAGGHLLVAVEEAGEVNASAWLRSVLPCAADGTVTVTRHPELQDWLRTDSALSRDAATKAGTETALSRDAATRAGTDSALLRDAATRAGKQSAAARTAMTNAFAGLPEDAAFEAAPLQVVRATLKDGHTLVRSEGHPLMVTADRGRGRITVLLFSPEREPARSWKNLPTFWAKLAEIPQSLYLSSDYRQRGGWSVDGVFGAMIDSRQVRKLPVSWLLLLLVVYLLVIGPLDRWWLRKINRPMLTWITFPGYVVLFSLLIYYIGYKLRAGETEWNELHVVDVLPAGENAELRGRTFASVYSPVNASYPVEGRQQFAALRGEFRGSWGGVDSADRGAVLQTGDNFQAELFVPVWTSQLYVNDWWQPAPLPLSVRVARRADGWEVTAENRLDQVLTNARLVVRERVFDLGELPAKQTKTFTLAASQGGLLREFVARVGAGFQGAAQSRQRALGRSTWIGDPPNASQAASFTSQVARDQSHYGSGFIAPPNLDLSPLVNRGQAVLLAWAADTAPVAPLNQFKPKRTKRDTLYRLAVSVSEAN